MRGKNVKYILVVVVLLALGFGVGRLSAAGPMAAGGTLDSPGPPESTLSYTLEDIYNRLNDGTAGTQSAFTEPNSGPTVGTGHTLNEIYDLIGERGLVLKTGQTTSWHMWDDGDLKKGVAWPSPRFTDNGDGTVTDNLTGLIWLKTARCFGGRNWPTALSDANSLASGSCGLSDGSSAGDWRLPNVRELLSVIDYGRCNPALPNGHPFPDVHLCGCWSSTTYVMDAGNAFVMSMGSGHVEPNPKSYIHCVWPVRGGQ